MTVSVLDSWAMLGWLQLGSAEVRAFSVPLRLFLAIPLYPNPSIGGKQHAIHSQPARRGDGPLHAVRFTVHAPTKATPPSGLPTLPSQDSNGYTLSLCCTPPRGQEDDPEFAFSVPKAAEERKERVPLRYPLRPDRRKRACGREKWGKEASPEGRSRLTTVADRPHYPPALGSL